MNKEDEYRKQLIESLGITEEIVNEKYKFKVNPLLAFIGLLLVQTAFLALMLFSIGGPL